MEIVSVLMKQVGNVGMEDKGMKKIEWGKCVTDEMQRQAEQPPCNLVSEDREQFVSGVISSEPEHQVEAEEAWNQIVDINEERERLHRKDTDGTTDEMKEIRKLLKDILVKIDRGASEQQNLKHEVWMTTEQAAKYLAMKPRGVRVAADKGRLPGHKNSSSRSRTNRWRFKRSELDKHMAAQKQTKHQEVTIYK
jgi:excisionase family DNA binding protein